MTTLKEYLLICTYLFAILALAFWLADVRHVIVRYDCSIAEISPDYSVAVKEACRKRSNK